MAFRHWLHGRTTAAGLEDRKKAVEELQANLLEDAEDMLAANAIMIDTLQDENRRIAVIVSKRTADPR